MARIADARQLGAVVRAERKRRGISQDKLASQAHVSRAWLARFETGHPAASIEQVFRVLRALDLNLETGVRRTTKGEDEILAALAKRGDI
jgi:transcriptional regulator with XRE-family HTH domain